MARGIKRNSTTLKERRFIAAFIETGGNKAESSRRAGYKAGSKGGKTDKASEAKVMTAIGTDKLEKLGDQIEAEAQKLGITWLTPEYVLNNLKQLAENGKQERSKITALELLGKSLALFTDKVETKNQILGIVGQITSEWAEPLPLPTDSPLLPPQ